MRTERIHRIIQILTSLQSEQRCRVDDLVEMLGVSRRTIFRDLAELQKAGVPCRCNRKDYCYAIDPVFFMPAPDLNTWEALGLLLLIYKAGKCIHFPFKNSALRAGLKIENDLPREIKRYCNNALQVISVKTEYREGIDLLDRVFARLLKAILQKQVVNIHYYLPHEQKNIVTNLNPYHLLYSNHTWCVIGKSAFYKQVSTFRLNRIKELNILDRLFIRDKRFDVSEYLGRAWSVAPEGTLYNIRLRFLPEIARSVSEVQWHSTQKVTFEKDGSAILEFRVDGLSEVTWWILGYGDQVQVLAPKTLREKIIKITQSSIKQYEQPPSV